MQTFLGSRDQTHLPDEGHVRQAEDLADHPIERSDQDARGGVLARHEVGDGEGHHELDRDQDADGSGKGD